MSAILLKIGGSLIESDTAAQLMRGLETCCLDAAAAGRPQQLLIVPGGGEFADAVRAAQKRHAFGEATAHHMALLAMHMAGAMLAELASGFVLAETTDEFAAAWGRGLTPIWAPERMVLAAADVPASWDVTSDSLAAWLASHIRATRLVIAKSCPVPATIAKSARELAAAGIVDASFPGFVEGRAFSWCVASGAEEATRAICSW